MAHILLIEDNADSADPVAIALRKRSHHVDIAENGQEALYLLLAGTTPDVILLDLQMPVMDGITFLDHLRSIPKFRSLPVVVISALSSCAAEEIEPYHVSAVLTKGYVDLQALAQSIERSEHLVMPLVPPQESFASVSGYGLVASFA